MISVAEAKSLIQSHVHRLEPVNMLLGDALGCCLAAEVI